MKNFSCYNTGEKLWIHIFWDTLYIIKDINFLCLMSSKAFEIIASRDKSPKWWPWTCSKRTNIGSQRFYASPMLQHVGDAQTAQQCLANIFMHHQCYNMLVMRKQQCWPTFLCITNVTTCWWCANSTTLLANIFMHHHNMLVMRKQHNIVGQHFYASPMLQHVGDAQTAQHCWPTFLCITNVTTCWWCANSTTLLANIFMHHQCYNMLVMRKQHNIVGQHFYASSMLQHVGDAQTAQHCWPTFLCITNVTNMLVMRKQHNIVGQHFYASPMLQHVGDAQTAQHCWPTFLCITNVTTCWWWLLANIFMHHQCYNMLVSIVGQHASQCWPTFLCITNVTTCWWCANSTTLLANIFIHHQCYNMLVMRKQHNIVGQHFYASPMLQHVGDAQTAQHCWPTFLCITNANMLVMRKQHNIVGQHHQCYNMLVMRKQHNIVGQHFYASPMLQHVGDAQTAQHCWPTFLCITNVTTCWWCANSTTLLANIFMHHQCYNMLVMRKQHNIVGQHFFHQCYMLVICYNMLVMRKQHNIVGQRFYAEMRKQHKIVGQHCWQDLLPP